MLGSVLVAEDIDNGYYTMVASAIILTAQVVLVTCDLAHRRLHRYRRE